jgi:hypothetical protein
VGFNLGLPPGREVRHRRILVGIFATDEIDSTGRVVSPRSVGIVHMVVSALAFVAVIVAMFVLSRTFKRHTRWQAFWP